MGHCQAAGWNNISIKTFRVKMCLKYEVRNFANFGVYIDIFWHLKCCFWIVMLKYLYSIVFIWWIISTCMKMPPWKQHYPHRRCWPLSPWWMQLAIIPCLTSSNIIFIFYYQLLLFCKPFCKRYIDTGWKSEFCRKCFSFITKEYFKILSWNLV